MYGKNGWVLAPVHRDLPLRTLTAKEKRENAKATREWKARRIAILKIAKEAHKKAAKFGGYISHGDDEDGPSYPDLRLPHYPFQYDFSAFTGADRAVYDYQQGHWPQDGEKALADLRRLMNLHVPVRVSFDGISGGSYPPSRQEFDRDGPKIPDFVNCDIWP